MAAVQNATASLTIAGDDLDPAEVTALLGCTPTEAFRKGDAWSARHPNRHWAHGIWILASALDRDVELETQIAHLLSQVSNDAVAWQQISARFFSRIFCGIFMDQWNEGFGLTPTTLARLSTCGLHLDVDLYGPSDDEEPDETSKPVGRDGQEQTTC